MLLRESIEKTHSWDTEFRVVWPDGSIHWLLGKGKVFLDDSGTAVRMAGVNLDITDRKRAETNLRESEERFRRVFEEGPLGIGLVSKDYRFTRVNSALCQMVGYTEEELTEKTFADITHPDDVRVDVDLAERLFKREIPFYRIEKRYVKKTGEIIWINLTASLILGPDGAPLHGLAMIEDITEVRRNQEWASLRQKLESVGSLAGGIAHDFNNILGAILAQADLGLAEIAGGAVPTPELENIRAVAIRGTGIGRQLMIYAGQESSVSEPVDVSRLIEDMRELLKVSVSKHAVLRTELTRDPAPVLANPTQLGQVVMNLVTNASEAIGERDGMIFIRTRQMSAVVNSNRGGPSDCIELEISDTGSGMIREAQSKIFDPFFTTKSAGHGLGLAVVQRIIQQLNGAIHLDTEIERGTTFRILLPIASETAQATQQTTESSQGGELRCEGIVLLVEDESAIRVPVARMLRAKGLRVVEAEDGTEALVSIREHKDHIALVLLDATLPGAPSREIWTEARRAREDMKIIVISAYGQNTVDAAFPGMQIEAFLRKPYTLIELMNLMARVLSGERLESSASAMPTTS